jgi:hypothetical protein
LVAQDALPPLRGSDSFFALFPWAYAHGYMLPSLRDSGSAQLQNLRFGLRWAEGFTHFSSNFITTISGVSLESGNMSPAGFVFHHDVVCSQH